MESQLSQRERYDTMGRTQSGRTVLVVHTDNGDVIRVISAREATRREVKVYEEGEGR